MERFFKLKERGTIGEVNSGERMGLTAVFYGLFFFVAMLLTH